MKKILLVEDDQEIAKLTQQLLGIEGYQCHWVADGLLAEAAVREFAPDLVLLDLMLPGLDGVSVCQQLRGFYSGAILVLTGKDDDISELTSLKSGADDFVLKPLKPHILLARIENLLKRLDPDVIADTTLDSGALSLNPQSRQASLNEQKLHLSTAEFDLLALLMDAKGSIVSREQCCLQLRGIELDAFDRSIDMRISSLRKKIAQIDDSKDYIITVRNQGYVLVATY